MRMKIRNRHSQKGAVLIVSLLLLLGLTAVGIASMKETITQQKVVNSVVEDDMAFQAAEIALRDGESFVLGYIRTNGEQLVPPSATFNGQTVEVADERGTTGTGDMADNWWKKSTSTNWNKGAQALTYAPKGSQSPPTFLVEILGRDEGGSLEAVSDDNKVWNYRITARGYGMNSSYYVVLQTILGVQL
jgi:type IV pilus assembly protein PilX